MRNEKKMMSKKVYEKVAVVLAVSRSLEEIDNRALVALISRFQIMFKSDNEAFDSWKFSRAVYENIEKLSIH